ncbi:hypothetical protein K378_03035 [Streptomyces sp. Amel2xB2]|uniref:hypothetical protein n=1 Tax=Streptomyces sp. Amel2xB2 TaxID=1305829 RepID=UPI000DBA0A77|nr:hypothetical protein [Streptomyces sp. Amel2xB2]RAJ65421.1 hypothetical protein K378_03035 [Streptomyces sp. Amel2xB2]
MRNPTRLTAAEPESMDQLLGDCARMAPHWRVTGYEGLVASAGAGLAPGPRASYEKLSGVRIPAASARVAEGMSEYGVW